jgi:Mrp family chromosome partitioning ATPase
MEASLEARLAALRDEIAAETRALSRMRQASGMDVMPAGTVLDQRISEAVRTLAVQSSQLAAAQARFDRAKRSVERGSIANTDQGTTLSPLLEDLYQKRAAAVRSESYLDPQIGPQHPTRKGLAEERRKLDVAIKAELDRVLYELGEAVSAATVREQNARADLALLRAQSEQVLPRRLEVGAAERHLASLQAAHDELLRERQRLLVIQEGGGDAVRIAAPAVPPQLAAGPRKKPAILMGGAVSAVFAAIIALFRGVMAGQSASSERYRAVVGAAEVYEFSALPGRTARRAWRGLAGERRALQTSVPREARNVASWLLSRRERFGHGVVVSSPDAREGKTLISALLAMGAASLGARTLLVDGDFYAKATVSNLKRAKALGEVEASGPESPAGSPIYRTGLTNLWACPLEGHLVDLVSTGRSDGLQRWLANLSSDFDLIIIDAPPLLSTIGATVLARAAPINVMVHDTSRSSIAELAEAAKLYRMFNITTDMLILNRFRGKAKSYRRYSDFPLKDSRDASAGGALVSPYRHPPQGGPV